VETPINLMNEEEKPKRVEPAPDEQAAVPRSNYADPAMVIVIPRVVVNYVIIAVVFFALGTIISGAATSALFNANSQENRALIESAVASALDARGGVAQQPALQPGQRYDVSADDDPVIGDPNAPITVVEFADFHCQYCSRFQHETLYPLLNDFAGKIRLVYRDYPILGQGSVLAALAAECMKDQGKFWEFHDITFDNQQNLTREAFVGYAQQFGIDVKQFTTCLDQQQHIPEITKDANDAQALGVTGTPAFFVNGTFISGAQPYAVFASAINQELGRLSESTPEPASSS
jgi:protein-disulfide isomerase